ncbi:hypothetical protein Tco_0236113 [Tanacetum coccineum]
MAERGRTVVTARKIKTGYGFPKKPPSRLGNDRDVWTAYFVSLQWKKKSLATATPLSTAFFLTSIVQDFQDSPDDEKDTRSNEEDLSSDVNEMTEVKVLMALADDESVVVGKESVMNGEWVKISMKKVHTLLDMEDNDERKSFLDYFCIDLSYVKEQRNNLVLKHRDLVQELNTCKEHLLVLKQAKLDFLTMQRVNIKIIKENKNIRKNLKKLITITETWLNSSNKVNQCISEQITSQKKRILGHDQLTEDPSSSGQTDLVFQKSLADYTKVSIPSIERPWLSEAKGFTLPNHDTGRILSAESQVKITDPSVAITDSSATEYDLVDESLVCSTPLPPLEKLAGVEPVSGPKTIKSILNSNSPHFTELNL